ncbi:hypothetical protein [Kineosporia babensis]
MSADSVSSYTRALVERGFGRRVRKPGAALALLRDGRRRLGQVGSQLGGRVP